MGKGKRSFVTSERYNEFKDQSWEEFKTLIEQIGKGPGSIVENAIELDDLTLIPIIALALKCQYKNEADFFNDCVTINTIAQPGYAGCLNLELTNNNNNPINLAVGARVIQGFPYKTSRQSQYFSFPRKYVCQVRPESSAVINDKDLAVLTKLWMENNNL